MRKSSVRKSLLAIPGIAGVAGLGLLSAAPARADTIFSADFEAASGYGTAGPLPGQVLTGSFQQYNPSDPANAGVNGVTGKPASQSPNWNENWMNGTNGAGAGGYNDAYVVANPNTSAPPAPTITVPFPGVTNSSAQVAAIVGQQSGGTVASSKIASDLSITNTIHPLTLTVSAYYASATTDGGKELLTGGANLPNIAFGEGGYWNGNGGTLSWSYLGTGGRGTEINSPALAPDAWHTATFTINFNANPSDLADSTLDFSVDGVVVQDGIPYNASGLSAGTATLLMQNDDQGPNDGPVYFDNVSIAQAVPEPASLSLLALGGMLLARRRSRKSSPENSES